MSKTEITNSERFYECDLCHEVYCRDCENPQAYMKWKLCPNCFNPFHSRHHKRWKKILQKRNSSAITFIPSAEILKPLFKGLASLYDELILIVEKENLIIHSIDASRISCVKATIPIKQGGNKLKERMTVKADDFYSGLIELKDHVNLSMEENKLTLYDKILHMEFLQLDIGEYVKEDIITKNIEREYTNTFLFEPEEFIRISKALGLYSKLLTIKNTQDSITFLSEKHKSKASAKISLSVFEYASIEENEEVTYDNLFVEKLNDKLEEIIEEIIVSIKTDSPIKFEYLIEQDIILTMVLAPRVEEVDD